jgi:putative lipoprotein
MPFRDRWLTFVMPLVLAFVLLIGLGACASGPSFSTLEARVVSEAPLDLPPDAELSVQLENISQAGANLVAEARYVRLGDSPIPVMVHYDAGAIDEGDAYVLRADIRADNRLLYTTTDPVPVLTGEAPDNNVTLPVERAD